MEHQHESFFADPRLWVAVSFTIFFLIFGKKLASVVTGILDKRAADVRRELDAASALRIEAEAMLRDATARREQAMRDAATLLEQAHAEAGRVAVAARTEAATSAKRREQMALDRIAAAEKAAVTDVRLAAADIAARAAERVLAQTLGPDVDASLIDRAIQGLPAALRAA